MLLGKKYLLITSFFLQACHNSNKSIDLKIDSLKYTVYWWNAIDSSETYNLLIDHYIQVDKKGKVMAYKRSVGGYDKFYNGQLDNSLKETLTQAFINQDYDSIYISNEGTLYCGPSKFFDYSLNGKRYTIKFPNGDAPSNILLLSNMLDSFIALKVNNQTKAFDINEYKNELMRIDTINHPLPKFNNTKFEMPVIK